MSHTVIFRAAIEERRVQTEKFHPDDWNLDHDHRMTYQGMLKLSEQGEADLQEWVKGISRYAALRGP